MRNLLLVATLLLSGYSASCQATSAQVCLSVPQAAKIQDSLRVLPVVRQEAAAWHKSSRFYQLAADSLWRANTLNADAVQASQRAFVGQALLTANEASKTALWKGRAQRRGWLNVLLLAGAGGLIYSFSTR